MHGPWHVDLVSRCPDVLTRRSDENRGHLLEAGFLQTTLSILEGYVEPVPASPPSQPWPLSLMDLKIVKTAVGVVLNISLGFGVYSARCITAIYL